MLAAVQESISCEKDPAAKTEAEVLGWPTSSLKTHVVKQELQILNKDTFRQQTKQKL